MTNNNDFDAIIGAQGFEAPKHVFEYETVTVEGAPAGMQENRQWLLIGPEGTPVAIGPVTGGGKSAFIKFAAENPGHRVANRRVTFGEWNVPTE